MARIWRQATRRAAPLDHAPRRVAPTLSRLEPADWHLLRVADPVHGLARPVLDAVLTMILVSWGSGAVSTSSTVMRAFLAFASQLFLPAALMWALGGTRLGRGVAVLIVATFGAKIGFAKRNLKTLEESFRIRLENEELAKSLEFERAQLSVARDAAVKANREKSRFLASAKP